MLVMSARLLYMTRGVWNVTEEPSMSVSLLYTRGVLRVFRHSVATWRNKRCTAQKHVTDDDVRQPGRTDNPAVLMPYGAVLCSVARFIHTESED